MTVIGRITSPYSCGLNGPRRVSATFQINVDFSCIFVVTDWILLSLTVIFSPPKIRIYSLKQFQVSPSLDTAHYRLSCNRTKQSCHLPTQQDNSQFCQSLGGSYRA